jgi:hypothetical protein
LHLKKISPPFKEKKKSCWPMTIKIVVGQQLFILAISTVKCRNGWPANK